MSRTISIHVPVPGSRGAWLAGGLVLGLIAAVVGGPLMAIHPAVATDPTTTNPEHTISVSGTGKVILSPDTADLRLGVTSTASTVKVARATAASAMTAVIAGLRKLGIAEADIKTTTLSLQPTYDHSGSTYPPKVTGYSLTNALAVTIRNLDVLGDAIDGALAAGATSLDGVTFRVADEAAAERQARQSAIAEAAAKAKTLADAAHVALGGVASISESVAPVPYPQYSGLMAAAAKDVATPVMTGTTEISVTVAVVYLIG